MDEAYRKIMEAIAKTELERFSFGEKMARVMEQAMKPSMAEMLAAKMAISPHRQLMETIAQQAMATFNSPSQRLAEEIARQTASAALLSKTFEQLALPTHLTTGWAELMERISPAVQHVEFARDLLQDRFGELSRMTSIAESIAKTVDFGAAHSAIIKEIEAQRQLRDSLSYLSESATAFSRSIEASAIKAFAIDPALLRFPSIEVCNHTAVISRIVPVTDSDGDEIEELHEDLEQEIESDLVSLLDETYPDLKSLWVGARQTVASTNPDATRHLTVSLRELFDHLLRTLAPDDFVKSWSTDPKDIDEKGRPTRRARLRYLYRHINEDAFCGFVDKDIDAALKLLDVFQGGTHNVKSTFSTLQRRALLTRAEGVACFLLQISISNR